MAAQRLGIKELPCIRLDHMTDEERRAYTLAHNKIAEGSFWDDEALGMEMDALDYDWGEFGFYVTATDDGNRFKASEIDLDTFDDEVFKYECPECGFKFNT